MPIREVTKKRKGKANKRTTSNKKMLVVRGFRAAFFILIAFLIVFFYYLYESGSLLTFFKRLNLREGFSFIINDLNNPYKIVFFLFLSLLVFGIGYKIGKNK